MNFIKTFTKTWCGLTFNEWLKLTIALAAVVTMYQLAWHRGKIIAELGVGYWCGWQDAMTQTDYGTKPYDSNKRPLED